MQLSKHFSLAEMTRTSTGLPNVPDSMALLRLRFTAKMMELVRAVLGNVPVLVSSAFRSRAVNAKVGGSDSSDHVTGQAVDFTAPGFGPPRAIVSAIAKSDILFDQLIFEFPSAANNWAGAWVHISFRSANPRRQVLTAYKDRQGRTRYAPGILSPTQLVSLT